MSTMIRTLVMTCIAGFTLALWTHALPAETSAAFETRVLEPMMISSIQLNPDKVGRLRKSDRADLESARGTLSRFFKLMEDPDGVPQKCMTPSFVRVHPDRIGLRRALVADETTVLQIAMLDFEFSGGGKALEFSFYAVVMPEGSVDVGEGTAKLEKTNEGWKLSSVGILRPEIARPAK